MQRRWFLKTLDELSQVFNFKFVRFVAKKGITS
jgi:hypothetical protein